MAGHSLLRKLSPLLMNAYRCAGAVGQKFTNRSVSGMIYLRTQPQHASYTSKTFPCIHIQNEADFEKVLENSTPVIVDFHATWCGPCKLLGPRLESIIGTHEGKVILAKVDIDENTDLAIKYGVESVPTVIAVKNGKVLDQFVGLQDDDIIKSFIEKNIG